MAVPYTFGTATAAIPLSQLDSNFSTAITIGNTAVQLSDTVTTLNNMTLANVTISSGTITITNVAVTTANVSGTANISTLVVTANASVAGNVSVTGNITAANANVTTNLVLSGGTANGVAYLNTSKQLTTGSALVFDGTNLGVGIIPTTALHVSSASNTFATVESTNGAGYWQMIGNNATNASYNTLISKYGATTDWSISGGNGTTGQMLFNIGSTEGFRLTSTSLYTASGINVGIGMSSPQAKLQVKTQTDGNAWFRTYQSVFSGSTGVAIDCLNDAGSAIVPFGIRGSVVSIGTSVGTAATFDASGNLLVGTTDSSATVGNGLKFIPGTGATCRIVGSADTNANFAHTVYSTSPAAYRFQVGWGGTIYATSTSITAISDASLKTNVRDLETGLTEVLALQPRRFDWINGDASNVAGFIAQEVQKILPDLVEDYQYSDEETKLGLKMGDILPTLVKAIQEQQALITQLTARITALEGA